MTQGNRRWMVAAFMLSLCAGEAVAEASMFRCEHRGETLITDREFEGASCQSMRVSSSSRADSVKIAALSARRATISQSTKPSQADSIAADQAKHQQHCDRMRLRLTEIDNKFRAGYTLQQGERLKERKRVLNGQLKIEGCR